MKEQSKATDFDKVINEVDVQLKKGVFPDSIGPNKDVIWAYGAGDRENKAAGGAAV